MIVLENKQNDVQIAESAIVYDNVIFVGKCVIGEHTIIYPNSVIDNSCIGDGCVIKSSYIEGSIIKNNVTIGPFAHIRPNSIVDDNCKIGNFVEIKHTHLGAGTKASHLAYVGDAEVGKNCNIGCGAIFVNYNGKEKNKIKVGDDCFIGSNCNLIAPLNMASHTYLCAGTTLTHDSQEYDFIIGRVRETVKTQRAKEYLKEE